MQPNAETPWKRGATTLQLLGLCPLLALAATPLQGLALGLAIAFTLMVATTTAALLRHRLDDRIRPVALLLIIAATASCAQWLLAAFVYTADAWTWWLALVAGHAVVIQRAVICSAAEYPGPLQALRENSVLGAAAAALLVTFGAARSLLGAGSLSAEATVAGIGVMLTPAGAFILIACLLALKNRLAPRPESSPPPQKPDAGTSRRVRVTGPLR